MVAQSPKNEDLEGIDILILISRYRCEILYHLSTMQLCMEKAAEKNIFHSFDSLIL